MAHIIFEKYSEHELREKSKKRAEAELKKYTDFDYIKNASLFYKFLIIFPILLVFLVGIITNTSNKLTMDTMITILMTIATIFVLFITLYVSRSNVSETIKYLYFAIMLIIVLYISSPDLGKFIEYLYFAIMLIGGPLFFILVAWLLIFRFRDSVRKKLEEKEYRKLKVESTQNKM